MSQCEHSQPVTYPKLSSNAIKGLAVAHETYLRPRRGELFYALSLLGELRQHIMHADDWLHDRIPETAVVAKFDMRGRRTLLAALKASYSPCEVNAIVESLRLLAETYRMQLIKLHGKFGLVRPLASDLKGLDIVQSDKSGRLPQNSSGGWL